MVSLNRNVRYLQSNKNQVKVTTTSSKFRDNSSLGASLPFTCQFMEEHLDRSILQASLLSFDTKVTWEQFEPKDSNGIGTITIPTEQDSPSHTLPQPSVSDHSDSLQESNMRCGRKYRSVLPFSKWICEALPIRAICSSPMLPLILSDATCVAIPGALLIGGLFGIFVLLLTALQVWRRIRCRKKLDRFLNVTSEIT